MNRARRAATNTHNRTVDPPSLTDLSIDRRPLPLAHLQQRGGAVQTKRSRRPSHRFRSRRRCRGYCTTRTAVLSAHALPRVPGRPRCAGWAGVKITPPQYAEKIQRARLSSKWARPSQPRHPHNPPRALRPPWGGRKRVLRGKKVAGGGRRRPEATEGEARVKNRPFLFRSKEQRKKAPSQNNHNNPRRRRRSLRWLPCRRRRQRHFTETAPERQRRGEKRRSAGGENGGRAEKNTHRAPHTTTPTTAAARAEEEKRGPKETQSRAGDLRSRRGIQRRARSELRCVINPHNRAVGSWR